MAYIVKTDINAYINNNDLLPFLDDNRDGAEDPGLWDQIVSSCSCDVDGRLASIYATPFNPVPAKVKAATIIFVCEALYARRLTPTETNPFSKRADLMRSDLSKVGSGDMPLDESFTRGFAPGAAITAPIVFATSSM